MLVNFEILKQHYFVNAKDKYFEGKIFMNDNRFVKFVKIFPLEKTCYTVFCVGGSKVEQFYYYHNTYVKGVATEL